MKRLALGLAFTLALASCNSEGIKTGNTATFQVQEVWGTMKVIADTGQPAGDPWEVEDPGLPYPDPLEGADPIRIEDGECLILEMANGEDVEVLVNLPPEGLPLDVEAIAGGEADIPEDFQVRIQGEPRDDLLPRCGAVGVIEANQLLESLMPIPPPQDNPVEFAGSVVTSGPPGCPPAVEAPLPPYGDYFEPGYTPPPLRLVPVGAHAPSIGHLVPGTNVVLVGLLLAHTESLCGELVDVTAFHVLDGPPPPPPPPAEFAGVLRQSPENEDCWVLVPPDYPLPWGIGEAVSDFDGVPGDDFLIPPSPFPGAPPVIPSPLPQGPAALLVGGDGETAPAMPGALVPGLLPQVPTPLGRPRRPLLEPAGPIADDLKAELGADGSHWKIHGFPRFGAEGACGFGVPIDVTSYEPLPPPPLPPPATLTGVAGFIEAGGGCPVLLVPGDVLRPIGPAADAFWSVESNLNQLATVTGGPPPILPPPSTCPGKPFQVETVALGAPEPPPPPMAIEGNLSHSAEGCLVLATSEPKFYALLLPHEGGLPPAPVPPFDYAVGARAIGREVPAELLPEDFPCLGIPFQTERFEHLGPPPPAAPVPFQIVQTGDAGVGAPAGLFILRSQAEFDAIKALIPAITANGPFNFGGEMLALVLAPSADVVMKFAAVGYTPPHGEVHVVLNPSGAAMGFALASLPRIDLPVVLVNDPPPPPP
ncbi:MAG: hypothetical protein AB1405_16105 [Bdellovibrionota bacterium]